MHPDPDESKFVFIEHLSIVPDQLISSLAAVLVTSKKPSIRMNNKNFAPKIHTLPPLCTSEDNLILLTAIL